MKYDLHIHTSCSDGSYSKLDLLKFLNDLKYEYVAFADHNYIELLSEKDLNEEYYKKYKEEQLVKIIDAIEFDVYENSSMHILGYDIKNKMKVYEKIKEIKKFNTEICKIIIEKIRVFYGINMPLEELLYIGNGNIAKTDITYWLVKCGYAKDYKEAGYLYTSKYSPCYEKKYSLSIREVLSMIESCGGISVLAHPSTLKLTNDELKNYVILLLEIGLKGIEVNNLDKTNMQELEYYKKLATELDLLRTCGSDFHNESTTKLIGLDDDECNEFIKKIKRY